MAHEVRSILVRRALRAHGLSESALAYGSVFDVVRLSRAAFVHQYDARLSSKAGVVYDSIMGYAHQLARLHRRERREGARDAGLATADSGLSKPTYSSLFKEDWLSMTSVDGMDADMSPVAYLAAIYDLALNFEKQVKGAAAVQAQAGYRCDVD